MCFAAEASFASGAVIGGMGLACLPKIKSARELLLGTLPLMFAIHQFEEGIVWLWLEDRVSPQTGRPAMLAYIVFAHALLPMIVPWAFWLSERHKVRRRLLIPLLAVGTGICVYALWKIADGGVVATISQHSIKYGDGVTHIWWFAMFYFIVTCGPPLLSSERWVFAFGIVIVATLIASAILKQFYLTSVWCAAAAVASMLIYFHLRRIAGKAGARGLGS